MIRIKNVYYMLAYAFQVLREEGYAKIAVEEFANASDLLAAILAKGIANQIKRGLGKEYNSKVEAISSPIGKINVSSSIRQQTLLKKQLVCTFDEFTDNTYLNKILKTTSMILIRSSEVSLLQKRALKKAMVYFAHIDELDPLKIRWPSIKYHRNNATYEMLVNICYLVIEGMLLSENEGKRKLARYIDDQRMHRLYEKFVFEYYHKHYPQFNVSAAHINWDVDDGMMELLPTMKSDITLQFQGKTLIIDTKYYSRTMQAKAFSSKQTIHSQNMYQIFTYIKNKDTTNSGSVSGILLYAKTDEEIVPDNDYMISGNRISVKTLDLNEDFPAIENQLSKLVTGILI